MRTEQAMNLNIAERIAKATADRTDKEHLGININIISIYLIFFS
jgi:hypothetical protein